MYAHERHLASSQCLDVVQTEAETSKPAEHWQRLGVTWGVLAKRRVAALALEVLHQRKDELHDQAARISFATPC